MKNYQVGLSRKKNKKQKKKQNKTIRPNNFFKVSSIHKFTKNLV